MKVFFKCALRAGLADDARKRVAVLILVIVPVLDAAGVAEHVGGVIGLVNAHGRGVHLHAGVGAVLDERDERNVHVARKFKDRRAVQPGGGERIAQSHERARRVVGQRFADAVFAAKAQIERRAGDARGQAVLVHVLFVHPFERDEVFDERPDAAFCRVIDVGRLLRKGKNIPDLDALRVHQLDEAQQRVVQLVGRDER